MTRRKDRGVMTARMSYELRVVGVLGNAMERLELQLRRKKKKEKSDN
jgi:hypothetical protein